PAERLADLIEKLDNDSFEVREQATRDLKSLGLAAEKSLLEAVKNDPSPEAAKRIKRVRADLETGADWQRIVTALKLLEELPPTEVRELLQTPAGNRNLATTKALKTESKRRHNSKMTRCRKGPSLVWGRSAFGPGGISPAPPSHPMARPWQRSATGTTTSSIFSTRRPAGSYAASGPRLGTVSPSRRTVAPLLVRAPYYDSPSRPSSLGPLSAK